MLPRLACANACLGLCILHLFPFISGTSFRMQVGDISSLTKICLYLSKILPVFRLWSLDLKLETNHLMTQSLLPLSPVAVSDRPQETVPFPEALCSVPLEFIL